MFILLPHSKFYRSLTILSYFDFDFGGLSFGVMLEFLVLHPGIDVVAAEDAVILRFGFCRFNIFTHFISSDMNPRLGYHNLFELI